MVLSLQTVSDSMQDISLLVFGLAVCHLAVAGMRSCIARAVPSSLVNPVEQLVYVGEPFFQPGVSELQLVLQF